MPFKLGNPGCPCCGTEICVQTSLCSVIVPGASVDVYTSPGGVLVASGPAPVCFTGTAGINYRVVASLPGANTYDQIITLAAGTNTIFMTPDASHGCCACCTPPLLKSPLILTESGYLTSFYYCPDGNGVLHYQGFLPGKGHIWSSKLTDACPHFIQMNCRPGEEPECEIPGGIIASHPVSWTCSPFAATWDLFGGSPGGRVVTITEPP